MAREPDDGQDAAAGLPGVLAAARITAAQVRPDRAAQLLATVNQPGGFDCPGCAWPESDTPHRLEFCENGAKAIAWEATRRRVDARFFAEHPVAELAGWSDHALEAAGRLTEPMHRAPGDTHYRPVSWHRALQIAADHLRSLDSPDEAIFYTSGRTSNEAAFLYQLFARRFGTNNLPDCSNLCHESSGAALTETIGVGKGSVTLDDFRLHADLIVLLGANPGTNHPRMLTALEEAKDRGATVVAVNPLPEAGLLRFRNPQRASGLVGSGTPIADLHLQVRVNGDLALLQLVNRRLVELGAVDRAFIGASTEGFDEAAAHWEAADPTALLAACGLTAAEVEDFVQRVVRSRSVIAAWTMGLTQHRNAVATICEVVNFLLLRASIGRPGAGPCPIRGHSNVQGDRTMGITEKPGTAFLQALQAQFGFVPPHRPGHDVVGSIGALRDGRARVFVGLGGNFAAAAPDSATTYAALSGAALTVSISTKLNRTHVHPGREAIILPTLGRTEDDQGRAVTVEDSMSRVKASRGRVAPASPGLRSEPWIVASLARAVVGDDLPWSTFAQDYDEIRAAIAGVVEGFEAFGERLRSGASFTLPHPPRDERRFPTASGRARFTVNARRFIDVPPGHLLLQTIRSHDQFNTTVYGLDDRYRGIHGRRDVVLVHPADLAALQLAQDDRVDLVGAADDGERRLPGLSVVPYPTARGCAATYFPEANVLVPLDSYAETSRTPTSKSIVVRVERAR
jgi:molybdopterin-dependent oxidoreductase alpha subunit